jgi:hypothetical protein
MASKRLTTAIIAFNIIMSFLIFLSSQLVLTWLRGLAVQEAGFFIYSTNTDIISTIGYVAPIPNLPLIVFIIDLFVNALLYFTNTLKRKI